MSEWQFTYTLRESPRAKHVRLKVTPQSGLETVERHCPDYRRLNAQVREMWKMVPQWVASFSKER
jgi:hypothetical protein